MGDEVSMSADVTAFDLPESSEYTKIPYGKLGIIALQGTEEFAKKIDSYIVKWRKENVANSTSSLNIEGYEKTSRILHCIIYSLMIAFTGQQRR